jgi:hypothetical protein
MRVLLVFTFCFWGIGVHAQTPTITTYAGTGVAGFSGDGGPATSAQIKPNFAVALGISGELYITDGTNQRVRLISSTGIITTIAGNGTLGYSGDGGPATAAEFHPRSIATDQSGNLYIADYASYTVRKVDPAGIISTIAGVAGFSAATGDGGPATAAQMYPVDVAVDRTGNIFIADYTNFRVRKIDTYGIISTVAGTGVQGYSGDGSPATTALIDYIQGIHADDSGNVYISCLSPSYGSAVRKINNLGVITTVAGNGTSGYGTDGVPATSTSVNAVWHITTDWAGNLYIADHDNSRVRKVNTSGIITTVAGDGTLGFGGDGGPATAAQFYRPSGIAIDDTGNLYVGDYTNVRDTENSQRQLYTFYSWRA